MDIGDVVVDAVAADDVLEPFPDGPIAVTVVQVMSRETSAATFPGVALPLGRRALRISRRTCC